MSEAVEFAEKSTADRYRDEYPEFICPVDDDARQRTVRFTSDVPASVLEEAEAAATAGRAEAGQPSLEQRELTRSEKRDLDFSRDGVSVIEARYLKGLGEEYGVNPFQHVDLTEIDAVEDARPILERAKRSGGAGRGGGTAQYDDGATERRERERRANAERHEASRCDHARDKCRSGEPEACEILQERCGLSEDETTALLGKREKAGSESDATDSDSEPWVPVDKWSDLSGAERGAVSRAADGYHGAVQTMRAALADAEQAMQDAQAAAKALNGIRAGVDEGPVHFTALEDANAALLDLVRHSAAACHECHGDHGDHEHDVTSGDREDLRAFVRDGAISTPVGTAEEFGPARDSPQHPDDAVADREPKRGEPGIPERPSPPERTGESGFGDGGEQFASERQKTLTGDAADTSDTQFTLTGEDASEAKNRALPAEWTPLGGRWVDGPFEVRVERVGGYGSDAFAVMLRSDDGRSWGVVSGVPENAAEGIGEVFTRELKPPAVSFHSEDAAVPEAAAAAKAAVDIGRAEGQGGLDEFGG
jgi:hypothetical protein